MNFQRIEGTIDIECMQNSHVTMIGGAYGLTHDLARCGLGAVTLVDFDRIDASNPARQDLYASDLGRLKVEATAADLRRINPDMEIETHVRDFCSIPRDEFDDLFGHTDLLIDASDFFPVHARMNQEAVRLGKPSMWIGMYRGGRAGEIIHWVPDVTPACYRCICVDRYRAFHQGGANITSEGGTIFDLHLVDAVAGQIAVGILTRGAENRMGRLISQLGNRNLLQVKIDPEYRLGQRDIFLEYLGDNPANFSFTTIALPMEPEQDCPDCARLRASDVTHQESLTCAGSSDES